MHIRFYARLTAYLTTISQLDEHLKDIFIKLSRYDHIKEDKKTSIKKALEERKEEINKYKVWRDKVFAHLESKDSQEIKKEARLQYGGIKKDSSQEECFSIQPNPALEIFSKIDIVTQHETLREHYDNWEQMFIPILNCI